MIENDTVYGGATNREIAAALGCTAQNVDFVARQALRRIIRLFATGSAKTPRGRNGGRHASASA